MGISRAFFLGRSFVDTVDYIFIICMLFTSAFNLLRPIKLVFVLFMKSLLKFNGELAP